MIPTHPFPTLTCPRLILREFQPDDSAALFELRTNPTVLRYYDTPPYQDMSEADTFVREAIEAQAEGSGLYWAIQRREAPRLIGYLMYWRVDPRHFRAELAYALDPQWQGHGFAREALTAVLDYTFHHTAIHGVEANVNPANDRSAHLLESLGFQREGYFRESFYFQGRFIDSAIYTRLRSDYLGREVRGQKSDVREEGIP